MNMTTEHLHGAAATAAGNLEHSPAHQAFRILQFGFTVAPILAGLDKFFHLLVNWDKYQDKKKKSTSKSTGKLTNKQPTSNHIQECKNKKKEYIKEKKQISGLMWNDWCRWNLNQLSCLWYMIQLWYEMENKKEKVLDFIEWMKEKAKIYWYITPTWEKNYWEMKSKFDRWYEWHKWKNTNISNHKSSVLQFLDPNRK